MKKLFKVVTMSAAILSFGFGPVYAIPISGDGVLGDFTGTFDYSYTNSNSATLIISLTNTSPAANGGYLTGFVFNNPGDKIANVSGYLFSDTDFVLLGLGDSSVSAAPYGQFDVGAATGGSFEGGGSPSLGIAIGSNATFTFNFTGINLDTLTDMSFFNEWSTGTGAGGGYESFVARFRGFKDGGSDKVPGDPGSPVPEPTTMLLFGAGLAGLAAVGRRRKDV